MGNILLRDEGIGVHVANSLQESTLPENLDLEIIDGGTLPNTVITLGEIDKLVVVDAVKGGEEPGAIYRFRPEDINLENELLTSLHQVNLLEELWLAEKFGQKPKEVVIIGVEPEDLEMGLELSERLQSKVPQIMKIVLEEAVSNYPEDSEKGDSRE
jgi:hydrogenase maturation protease